MAAWKNWKHLIYHWFCLIKNLYTAQILSKLTGKLISANFIIGNIVQLKKKKRLFWAKQINIRSYNDTVEEMLYWRFSICTLKIKVPENTEFHLYIFTQIQVITDYLLFIRTRVSHFIAVLNVFVKIVFNVFKITSAFNIKLSVFWVRRKYNIQADTPSKKYG